MKKIFTLILVSACAITISAQNTLYFTPTGANGWSQANAAFSAGLYDSGGNATYVQLTLNGGVYSATLATTAYTQIRFFRCDPAYPNVGNETWGWNRTGKMPFDYATANHWIMNVSVWNEGTNDKQFFSTVPYGTTPPPSDFIIKIKQPGNEWSQIYIYSWQSIDGNNVQIFEGWPGKLLTNPDADGWYTIEVPPGLPLGNVIFNNNSGVQFDATNMLSVSACYTITASSITQVTCPVISQTDNNTTVPKVIRTEYFNLQGQKLSEKPQTGMVIAVPYYEGDVKGDAVKMFIRK